MKPKSQTNTVRPFCVACKATPEKHMTRLECLKAREKCFWIDRFWIDRGQHLCNLLNVFDPGALNRLKIYV